MTNISTNPDIQLPGKQNFMEKRSKTVRLVEALMQAPGEVYEVSNARLIETHISWLILRGEFAYKLKKPVNLGFVDFSSLAQRKFYCDEEIRLNKRTAPQIYLEVLPISGDVSHPRLGDSSNPFEYVVKMNRFEDNSLLLEKLSLGELDCEVISRLSRTIAEFHKQVKIDGEQQTSFGTPELVMQPMRYNFKQIREITNRQASALNKLLDWSENTYKTLMPLLEQRRNTGFVRECHGDLHLGNILYLKARNETGEGETEKYTEDSCVLFDCIEFNPNLRWIDTANDIAFTLMDFISHGKPECSHQLLNEYLELSGDYPALKLLPFYRVYRALVRAKVAALRSEQDLANQESLLTECDAHISLAATFTLIPHPAMVIMCGLSGSGKSTVAKQLVAQSGAVQIRSDVERKRLFDLDPLETSRKKGLNIYSKDANVKTFTRLKELSRVIIEAGYAVIVDATFIEAELRNEFKSIASALNVPFVIAHTTSKLSEIEKRLMSRKLDASEASLEQYNAQVKIFEKFTDREGMEVIHIDTDVENGKGGIEKLVAWIASPERSATG